MVDAGPTKSVVFILLCLIQLFYTPVSVRCNGNTIQGTSWVFTYEKEPIYNKNIVNMLNEVNTLEPDGENGHKRFQFNEEEVTWLTNSCDGEIECLKNKAITVLKYKEKMEAVQCLNSALLELYLYRINDMLERNMQRKYEKILNKSNEYTVTIARMLSWLYYGKVTAHNLLWRIYLRLLLIEDEQSLIKLNTREKLIEDQLANDLMQHLNLCRLNNYLPSKYLTDTSRLNKNRDRNSTSMIGQKLYNRSGEGFFGEIYSFANRLSYTYVTLSDIFIDYNVLFLKSKGIMTKWEETKLLLNSNKDIITSQPKEWIKRPYNSVVLHETAIRLIKANIMYLVWKYSIMLQKSLTKCVCGSVSQTHFIYFMNLFRKKMIQPLSYAIHTQGIADVILINALKNLTIIIENYDSGKVYAKQIHLMNTELKNITTEELHGLGVQRQQIQALFNASNIPPKINLKTSWKLIKQLNRYLSGIEVTIDFPFILFFLSGKHKLAETFHIPN